jgi:hypothetical protein
VLKVLKVLVLRGLVLKALARKVPLIPGSTSTCSLPAP